MKAMTVLLLVNKKSTLVSCLLTLITASAVGMALFLYLFNAHLASFRSQHNVAVTNANQLFNARLGDIRNSTTLLNAHIVDLLSNENNDVDVNKVFARVGKSLPTISQMRWLSLSGQEEVRVNFKNGEARPVPAAQLQNKKGRYYFERALLSSSQEVYLSSIDLNEEFGKVEMPYLPTIRSAIKFDNHPLGSGIFIINFELKSLFNDLRTLSDFGTRVFVAKGSGEWMVFSDTDKEWASYKKDVSASVSDSLETVWESVLQDGSTALVSGDAETVHSAVSLFGTQEGGIQEESIILIASTDRANYRSAFYQALIPSLLLSFAVGALSLFLLLRDRFREQQLSILASRLSEEKNALAEAFAAQQRLQDELVESEKMASLGMLVSGVAHELNTPIGGALMTISGISRRTHDLETLLPDKLSYEKLTRFIAFNSEASELAISNLTQCSELIKRFKRLAIDRGSESVVTFSLDKLIIDLGHSLKPILKKKKVSLKYDSDIDIEMTTYPGILSQVIQNFVVNSVEHGFDKKDSNEIVISVEREADNVTIKHTDNGKGVAEDVAETLFDPFITTARGEGNSGLGLHLVHQWVTKMLEGKVNVMSKDGVTVFSVTIPIAIAVQDEEEESERDA